MAISRTAFSSGVNTSFSSELNSNFTATNAAIENTSTGHDHDGTDSKQVDYSNILSTPFTILGSGYVEGNDSASQLGIVDTSFSTPDDLGNGVVALFIWSSTDKPNEVNLSYVAGNQTLLVYDGSDQEFSFILFGRDTSTGDMLYSLFGNSIVGGSTVETDFTLNAGETFYLESVAVNDTDYKYRWMAVLIRE